MTVVMIEMLREGEWKPVNSPPDIQVSANLDSGPAVTLTAGYIQPPWRVRCDDVIMFERAQ